jgi:hypothetical protein
MFQDASIIAAIGIPLTLGVLHWFKKSPIAAAVRKVQSTVFLSPNETEFYNRLCRSLPECHVMAQVSLGALLRPVVLHPDAAVRNGPEFQRIRRTYADKIVDYVVCNSALQVMAIIELDDFMQNDEEDARRDVLLTEAGYKVIRFSSRNKPMMDEIRRRVFGKPDVQN